MSGKHLVGLIDSVNTNWNWYSCDNQLLSLHDIGTCNSVSFPLGLSPPAIHYNTCLCGECKNWKKNQNLTKWRGRSQEDIISNLNQFLNVFSLLGLMDKILVRFSRKRSLYRIRLIDHAVSHTNDHLLFITHTLHTCMHRQLEFF